MSTSCLIGLGSNQALNSLSPVDVIKSSIYSLCGEKILINKISRFYKTPAVPAGSGPDYVNTVVLVQSSIGQDPLLEILHKIEQQHSRRRHARWGPRTLDMDLLAVDRSVTPNEAIFRRWMNLSEQRQRKEAPSMLVLPHPRMHERTFVLTPLMDIAPNWVHPVLRKSVLEMYHEFPLEVRKGIQPI